MSFSKASKKAKISRSWAYCEICFAGKDASSFLVLSCENNILACFTCCCCLSCLKYQKERFIYKKQSKSDLFSDAISSILRFYIEKK